MLKRCSIWNNDIFFNWIMNRCIKWAFKVIISCLCRLFLYLLRGFTDRTYISRRENAKVFDFEFTHEDSRSSKAWSDESDLRSSRAAIKGSRLLQNVWWGNSRLCGLVWSTGLNPAFLSHLNPPGQVSRATSRCLSPVSTFADPKPGPGRVI